MIESSDFQERTTRIIASFLQSALLLDDQLLKSIETPEDIDQINTPEQFTVDESPTNPPSPTDVAVTSRGNNPIRSDLIVPAFAQKGIMCAAIDPLVDDLAPSSMNADIIILDWFIGDQTGARALSILEGLIDFERVQNPHLIRFVFIYTTGPDLRGIRDNISEMLGGKDADHPKEIGETGLSWCGWHFVVMAKPGSAIADDLTESIVEWENLPSRIIEIMSNQMGGILPNMVIAGMDAIRQNTHRLLGRFPSDMDIPFITHRALLPNPEDASHLILSLLASELHAILEDEGITEQADELRISEWISNRGIIFPIDIKFGSDSIKLHSADEFMSLLKGGVTKFIRTRSGFIRSKQDDIIRKKLGRIDLTAVLNRQIGSEADDGNFAHLTIYRPHYINTGPVLTMGTVLVNHEPESPRYWVCIQPKCDALRLGKNKSRKFIFLELELTENMQFCTIVRDNDTISKCRRKRKPFEIDFFNFKSSDGLSVRAKPKDDSYIFRTTGGVKFRWLGQLRDEPAQQIIHDISTRLSRIGVDASEWLRLAERQIQG